MGSLGTPKLFNSHHFHSNKLLKLPGGAQRICSATNSGLTVRCCDGPSTTKVGRIGQDRFKEGALPGTYWKAKVDSELGGEVVLTFNKDLKKVTTLARSGENLLRVAEHCGMMIPNTSFCFEGSCYHCEMEVIGGAQELCTYQKCHVLFSFYRPAVKIVQILLEAVYALFLQEGHL